MKPSQVLLAAKILLETKGWIKGNYITNKGYCLSGALSYGCEGTDRKSFYDACNIVSKLIDPTQNDIMMYHVIESYNDLVYRTKEHVLELLDKSVAVAVESENKEIT
jgi:hypothetical protein